METLCSTEAESEACIEKLVGKNFQLKYIALKRTI